MMTPLFFCIVYIQFVDKIQVLFVIPVGLRECLQYFWVDLGRLWMRKNRTLVNGTKQDLEETNGGDNFGMVVLVVWWSGLIAPSTLSIQVQILLKLTIFPVKKSL